MVIPNLVLINSWLLLWALHITYGLPTDSFRDQRFQLYLKALKISAPFAPSSPPNLDVSILNSLLLFCDTAPQPLIFKALYLTYFFSFLRLSNLLPHCLATFDCTRQLAQGNSITTESGAVLLLKWSKTIQDRKSTLTIPLPNLGQSTLPHWGPQLYDPCLFLKMILYL